MSGGGALERLHADGLVVLPGVAPPELIARCDAEIGVLYDLYRRHDPLSLRTEFRRGGDGAPVLDRIDPVLDLSPSLQIVLADHVGPALETLFGEPVTLFKCKHILKEPGTAGYTLHQDFLYWQWMDLPPESLLSVMLVFSDFDPDAGPLQLFVGANRTLHVVEPHTAAGDLTDHRFAGRPLVTPQLNVGDGLAFDGLTPHKSMANHSRERRSVVFASFALGRHDGLYTRYYRYEMQRRARSLMSQVGDECFRGWEARIHV